MSRINEKLRVLLKNQGWTQAKLARRVHFTPDAVSSWVRGINSPSIDTLKELYASFIYYLLFRFFLALNLAITATNLFKIGVVDDELVLVVHFQGWIVHRLLPGQIFDEFLVLRQTKALPILVGSAFLISCYNG